METRITEIAKTIPDFEDFMKLSEEIGNLLYEKLKLEASLKSGEALAFKTAMFNEDYYINGKQPPISFVENAYKFSGIDGELLALRDKYASVCAELEKKRIQLDTYKNMLDVWRTLSANERSSSL